MKVLNALDKLGEDVLHFIHVLQSMKERREGGRVEECESTTCLSLWCSVAKRKSLKSIKV